MAKSSNKQTESFEQPLGSTVSPLSYQRTDGDSTNSLHDVRPEAEYYEPPMDPLKLAKGAAKGGRK